MISSNVEEARQSFARIGVGIPGYAQSKQTSSEKARDLLMSNPMTQLSQLLFRLARNKVGGLIIGWSFAHMSDLMPINKIYETDLIIAFDHPRPAHTTHILIVPKRNVASFIELKDEDIQHEIISSAQYLVEQLGLTEIGYRLIVNGGAYQDVKQLHFHLISDG